jgi:type IV pilus assembly protein PilQ
MNAMLAGLTVWASAITPVDVNAVRSVRIEPGSGRASVVIAGSRPPTFTVFKLMDPPRLVIDLAGADISAAAAPADGSGPVLGVTASQFANDKLSVGRVTVAMAEGAGYDVKAHGNDVVVSVMLPASGTADSKTATAVRDASEPAPSLAATTISTSEKRSETAKQSAPPDEAKPVVASLSSDEKSSVGDAVPQPADVVKSTVDEKVVDHPATTLVSVRFARSRAEARAVFVANGPVSKFELVELTNPPRLAVDLYGISGAPKHLVVPGPLRGTIHEARVGKHDGMVRVVMALDGAPTDYAAHRSANGLWVGIAQTPGKPSTGIAVADSALPSGPQPSIKDVTFDGGNDGGVVSVQTSSIVKYEISRPDRRTRVLTLRGVVLPKKLERSLDTTAFGGPVRMVSAFASPGEANVAQVVATIDGEPSDEVAVTPSGLHWMFAVAGKPIAAEAVIDGTPAPLETSVAESKASGFAAEAPNYAASGAPQLAKYTGRRVSFEFKEIDIHNLLRIIAEVSKKNIVVADNVSGKITIRLKNVPWDQALDLILKSKGLDKEVTGNIIRIAPLKDLEEERKLRLEARKAAEKGEPLKVRIMPVNYARAGDMVEKVKGVLTERGEIQIDTRTNVIIAKDTVEALARAEGLIRNLDTPTPEVLIESRIVEADTTFSRQIGIQWGGNVSAMPALGNPTGLVFPNTVIATGGSTETVYPGVQPTIPNWAVDLPAAAGTGSGGALAFTLGSAGGAALLNLRLSALEATGEIKTISAPKVTTLDNYAATISQGVSIPFSQVSAGGVNTQFIEARLELKVTPHVTTDGSVLMNISATNNQPDPALTGANGQPAISKKEAKTEVMVKDGDTTVIGGIYTRVASQNMQGLPLLAYIPILGWLFKTESYADTRTELLIFITPHIVNRSQVVAQPEAG